MPQLVQLQPRRSLAAVALTLTSESIGSLARSFASLAAMASKYKYSKPSDDEALSYTEQVLIRVAEDSKRLVDSVSDAVSDVKAACGPAKTGRQAEIDALVASLTTCVTLTAKASSFFAALPSVLGSDTTAIAGTTSTLPPIVRMQEGRPAGGLKFKVLGDLSAGASTGAGTASVAGTSVSRVKPEGSRALTPKAPGSESQAPTSAGPSVAGSRGQTSAPRASRLTPVVPSASAPRAPDVGTPEDEPWSDPGFDDLSVLDDSDPWHGADEPAVEYPRVKAAPVRSLGTSTELRASVGSPVQRSEVFETRLGGSRRSAASEDFGVSSLESSDAAHSPRAPRERRTREAHDFAGRKPMSLTAEHLAMVSTPVGADPLVTPVHSVAPSPPRSTRSGSTSAPTSPRQRVLSPSSAAAPGTVRVNVTPARRRPEIVRLSSPTFKARQR